MSFAAQSGPNVNPKFTTCPIPVHAEQAHSRQKGPKTIQNGRRIFRGIGDGQPVTKGHITSNHILKVSNNILRGIRGGYY
ncbi:hypothetical protein AA14_26360 [Salmonella enterica]|nr:hypothetical protein [Salmonella enterica]